MLNEIYELAKEYRLQRKAYIKTSWLKPMNVLRRWANPPGKVLDEHWESDWEFSNAHVQAFISGLEKLDPADSEIERFKAFLLPNTNMISGQMYYLLALPLIFAALASASSLHFGIKESILGFFGIASIGFVFERVNLNTEKVINTELMSHIDLFKSLRSETSNQ